MYGGSFLTALGDFGLSSRVSLEYSFIATIVLHINYITFVGHFVDVPRNVA